MNCEFSALLLLFWGGCKVWNVCIWRKCHSFRTFFQTGLSCPWFAPSELSRPDRLSTRLLFPPPGFTCKFKRGSTVISRFGRARSRPFLPVRTFPRSPLHRCQQKEEGQRRSLAYFPTPNYWDSMGVLDRISMTKVGEDQLQRYGSKEVLGEASST